MFSFVRTRLFRAIVLMLALSFSWTQTLTRQTSSVPREKDQDTSTGQPSLKSKSNTLKHSRSVEALTTIKGTPLTTSHSFSHLDQHFRNETGWMEDHQNEDQDESSPSQDDHRRLGGSLESMSCTSILCGEVRLTPCSCDIKCRVVKTCCSDFAEVCPGVYDDAAKVYGDLVNACVSRCSPSGILYARPCSNRFERILSSSHHPKSYDDSVRGLSFQYSDFEDKDSDVVEERLNSMSEESDFEESNVLQDSSSQARLEYLLTASRRAPVYDDESKLAFQSQEFFNNVSLNSGKGLIKWKTKFTLLSSASPRSLQELADMVDTTVGFTYIPPSWLSPTYSGIGCIPDVKDSCSKNKGLRYREHALKCMSGPASYVLYHKRIIYKNPSCFYCDTVGLNTTANPLLPSNHTIRVNDFGLSVLVSINHDNFELNHQKGHPLSRKWISAKCSIHRNASENSHPCFIHKCGIKSVLRPDGFCKTLAFLNIAVPATKSMSASKVKGLADKIACLINHFSSLDVGRSQQDRSEFISEKRFDSKSRPNLFFYVRLPMYVKTDDALGIDLKATSVYRTNLRIFGMIACAVFMNDMQRFSKVNDSDSGCPKRPLSGSYPSPNDWGEATKNDRIEIHDASFIAMDPNKRNEHGFFFCFCYSEDVCALMCGNSVFKTEEAEKVVRALENSLCPSKTVSIHRKLQVLASIPCGIIILFLLLFCLFL